MLFINRTLSLFLALMITPWALSAQDQLPVLKTKQTIKNIRYISNDGKVTYYQKNSGQLQYSTNFDFVNVMNSPKNSDHVLTVSEIHKKVGIEVIENPFRDFNGQKDNDLFLVGYKQKSKPKKIGEGTGLRFHQDSGIITYFKPSTRAIVVISGESEKRIKIVNDSNPFFVPQVIAISPSDIIYTDINREGHQAIILYNLLDKNFEVIFKAKHLSMNIDICRRKDFLIAGVAPTLSFKESSKIIKTPLYKGGMAKNWEQIYFHKNSDTLNIVCREDRLFFITTENEIEGLNLYKSKIMSLGFEGTKAARPEVIASFEKASQLFELGSLLLTSVNGKYYIVEGKQNQEKDKL